jgi:hypothetical protein
MICPDSNGFGDIVGGRLNTNEGLYNPPEVLMRENNGWAQVSFGSCCNSTGLVSSTGGRGGPNVVLGARVRAPDRD